MVRGSNLKQAYSQAPWRIQRQMIGIVLVVVIFSMLAAYAYLDISARSTAISRRILTMQSALEELKHDNKNLRTQLALITASGVMETRAKQMGFRPITTEETTFIVAPGYYDRKPVQLAPRASLPAASDAGERIPAQYTESLFEWLNRQARTPLFPALLRVQP
jgi:hypothetical protein